MFDNFFLFVLSDFNIYTAVILTCSGKVCRHKAGYGSYNVFTISRFFEPILSGLSLNDTFIGKFRN